MPFLLLAAIDDLWDALCGGGVMGSKHEPDDVEPYFQI